MGRISNCVFFVGIIAIFGIFIFPSIRFDLSDETLRKLQIGMFSLKFGFPLIVAAVPVLFMAILSFFRNDDE